MLRLDIPEHEIFVEETNEFISIPAAKLQLEHSLVSISKWEARWHKPFLGSPLRSSEKTDEEILDYIRCMSMNSNVDDVVFRHLPSETIEAVNEYINNPMSATTIGYMGEQVKNRETITSELIYYWMFKLGIPMDCQKWHLNRLMKLIEVFSAKEAPPQKMSAKQRAALNSARRAKYNTRG